MTKRSHAVKPDLNGKEVMTQQSSEYNVQPPPPTLPSHFFIHLCFPNEDMVEIEQKYKVLLPPAVTLLYAFGHSWFKEGVTKKAKVFLLCHMSDDDEAKRYLKEFVEQAKAAMVLVRMSRKKKMVQTQVRSTCAPRCGKKKFVPAIRSLNDILRAIDQDVSS